MPRAINNNPTTTVETIVLVAEDPPEVPARWMDNITMPVIITPPLTTNSEETIFDG